VSGTTVALVIGGVAVAGGAAYFVLRKPAAGAPPVRPTAPSSSSGIGSLIAQIGGRAVSQGITSIESAIGDRISDYFA
jgi:hypothetical protein